MTDSQPNLPADLYQQLDLEFALRAAGLGVWEYNPRTGVANLDERCRQLYGINKDRQITYDQAFEYIHADDTRLVREAMAQVLTPHSGGQYDVTFRTIGAGDGQLRWVRFMGQAEFTTTGEVIRFAGVGQDVTRQVDLRSQLEQSEARYRHLVYDLEQQVQQRVEAFEAVNAQLVLSNQELIAASQEQLLARHELEQLATAQQNAIELAQLSTFSVDLTTNLLTASPRTADWFGFDSLCADPETFIGGLEASERDYVRTSLYNTLQPESTGRYDVVHSVINAKTGGRIILHALGQLYRNAGGEPARIDGTAQDITAQRELQWVLEQQVQQRTDELDAANEALITTNEDLLAANESLVTANQALASANANLLRSNQNLEQFAYIASHDLQEPLRKIQQFSDLLKRTEANLTQESLGYIDRMQLAASRMSNLIRDLLAFSQIATTQAVVHPVDLAALTDQVLDTLSVVIQESGAQLSINPLPVVRGDESQLYQLFQNLLSNALKFSRQTATGQTSVPRIRVESGLVSSAALPSSLPAVRPAEHYQLITVSDNGIGFDDRYVDRIFGVFQRLHGKHAFAGTGVGLAIVAKVVTNHGGAITASSKPGEGATFRVYLPI